MFDIVVKHFVVMKYLTFVRAFNLILCLPFFLGGCCLPHKEISFSKWNSDLMFEIQRKDVSDERLLECISRLGRNAEPPSFWAHIANDDSFSLSHRSRCGMALFRRHGALCSDVRQLGHIIAPADWLRYDKIRIVDDLMGAPPLMHEAGSTVFAIEVLPGSISAVFLRVIGDIRLKDFIDTLRDLDNHKDMYLAGFGYNDDYFNWHHSIMPCSYHRPEASQ